MRVFKVRLSCDDRGGCRGRTPGDSKVCRQWCCHEGYHSRHPPDDVGMGGPMIPKNIYDEVSTYVGRGALPEGGGGVFPTDLNFCF